MAPTLAELVAFPPQRAPEQTDIAALDNHAAALMRQKQHAEALAAYERLLVREPRHLNALNNCGGLHMRHGRPQTALACYDRALAVAPDIVELHINKGTALRALNRLDDALASFTAAARLDPERAEARYNAGLVRLCLGQYEAGWSDFEWRWHKGDWRDRRRNFSAPLWRGDAPLDGKAILLHAEQGFGDTIQLVRYVPLLARSGARVILECPADLVPLLRHTEGVCRIVARGETLPAFDTHCPLFSLPLAFRTTLATIPNAVPYIKVPSDYRDKWATRFVGGSGMRVGLVWAGSPAHLNDHNRSIPLPAVEPLLAIPDVHFVALQKSVAAADAAWLTRFCNVTLLGDELGDFADAAAVVAALDLIIAVDTSVAHLAGALGKAVGLLVPFAPDWRWLIDRTDSPWYPTLRLFRQTAIGDWSAPLARLCHELAGVVAGRARPRSGGSA
jgi:hypothetical protein